MSTIHPPSNGVSYNSEEQAANTHISFRRTELTAEQMVARDAELRANAPKNPNSHSAANAERAAKLAEQTEARRLAAVEGSADKKAEGIQRRYEKDGTWNEIAPRR